MDKRTISALVLIFAIYLVFDHFIWKPQREHAQKLQKQQSELQLPDSLGVSQTTTIPLEATGLAEDLAGASEAVALSLENDVFKVDFSSQGAAITGIELKEYKREKDTAVNLVPTGEKLALLSVYQPEGSLNFGGSLFLHEVSEDLRSVSFYLGEKEQPSILKRYTLDASYGIRMEIEVAGVSQGLRLDFSAGIADSENYVKNKQQDYRFFLYANNSLTKQNLAKMRKNQPQGSFDSFDYIAVRSKYFSLALKEDKPALSKSFNSNLNSETANPGFSLDSYHKEPKANWSQSFILYAGPADAALLKPYAANMENIAERGPNWLRWLANIFALFLNWLHRYVRNYGVVLIILALLLKVILHPLTHKSMDAQFKMQKIQPQVQALQAKYKNDPQTMQIELSKLYKEAGANPMSGCLPLLLQMPIFISLYNVLRYSLDMRNAGFMLWIKDLSEPDPYLILPIIMGGFMLLQSLMMQPKASDLAEMDEKQKAMQSSQKMMTWMMPIMMFFIFRSMPAGLVLYWTTFNIFSVAQQYYLKKHYKK